jgi:hypothetical protein
MSRTERRRVTSRLVLSQGYRDAIGYRNRYISMFLYNYLLI